MLVGLFPQNEKAVIWLKANLQALEHTFIEIHRQNQPPVTVGGAPPDPSFYVLFSCADDSAHARQTADDALQALERLRTNEREMMECYY